MTMSQSNYRTMRLVGIGHYSRNHREIAREAARAFYDRDPWVVAAGIHNVGHLARRFGIIDWPLIRAAEAAASRNAHQHMVRAALVDMHEDVAGHMPFRKYLNALALERAFEAD